MTDDEVASDDHVIKEHRSLLVKARQESQSAYDKAVMTLAGGALAVSITFLKDIAGKNPALPGVILLGWGALVASLLCILASFAQSGKALTKAIYQLDAGERGMPGGESTKLTETLNRLAGVLLGLGFLLIVLFAFVNMVKS